MADGAIDTLADERIERRAHAQRQIATEAEVGQTQAHDRIDRPSVHTPVEEGDAHGRARGLGGLGGTLRRVRVVHDRFGHAVEHQADAHARGEQHREPGHIAEVRFTMVGAQAELAEARQRQHDTEHQVYADSAQIKPAERIDQPGLHPAKEVVGLVRKDRAEYDEYGDDRHRWKKYRRIDARLRRLIAIAHALL